MTKDIFINGRGIGGNYPVYVIAEMSANHMQDINKAKEIISAAKEAGADAVKVQTYRPDTLTLDCYGEEFQATPGSPWEGMNLFDLYKKAYMPWEWHEELYDYAKKLKITFFSAPFDLTAVDFLKKFNMPAYKIASYEINDIPLIKKAAGEKKPIIISTGVATLPDIELAVKTCHSVGNKQIILLKCVSEYPTPYEELNLKTLQNMSETFNCTVGISDHSMGNCVAVASVALGAKIVEKHITLSRKNKSADSVFSMEPDEFRNMINDIRNVEKAIGHVTYTLTKRQMKSRERSRSLYVSKNIQKGELFTSENIKSVRPGYGLHTKYYESILGKAAKKDLKKGTALSWDYIL